MAEIQSYLDTIKNATSGEAVRDAIIKCMNDINSDVAVNLYPRTITKRFTSNGQWSDTFTAKTGYAMSKVTFDVTVDVDGGGSGGGGSSSEPTSYEHIDFTVDNDTENGEYEPSSNQVFDKVIVDLDVTKNDKIADNIDITIDRLDSMMGFSAIEDGYTAMKRVTFIGQGLEEATGGHRNPNGTWSYTAKFWKKPADETGNSVIKTVEYVSGTMPDPPATSEMVRAGYNFTGWNPPLKGSMSGNLNLYPVYSAISGGGGTIADDWKTIIANGAAPYEIGSTKELIVSMNVEYAWDKALFPDADIPPSGTYTYNKLFTMILVAKGERGTRSSWVSKFDSSNMIMPAHIPASDFTYLENPGTFTTYGNNHYKWLNGTFLNHILATVEGGKLKNGISNVTKNYCDGLKSDNNDFSIKNYINVNRQSMIWLPSGKELYISGDSIGWGAGQSYADWYYLPRIQNEPISLNYATAVGATDLSTRNTTFGNGALGRGDWTALRDIGYSAANSGISTDETVRNGCLSGETTGTFCGVSSFGGIADNAKIGMFGFCLG